MHHDLFSRTRKEIGMRFALCLGLMLLTSCATGTPKPSATMNRSTASADTPDYFDPRAYGGSPEASPSENRIAAQAAVDAAVAAGGGRVHFGRGVWNFDRAPVGSRNRYAVISTNGSNVTISCDSNTSTTLAIVGDQGGTATALISFDPSAKHVAVLNCHWLNKATNTHEQHHAVVTSGVCDPDHGTCNTIDDVTIEGNRCDWPRTDASRNGDCIRILGNSAETRVRGVRIINNSMNCGRSCIGIQRFVEDLQIVMNTMTAWSWSDSEIDYEATGIATDGTGWDKASIIMANTMTAMPGAQGDYALTFSSISGGLIIGNTANRAFQIYRSDNVSVTANRIDASTMTTDAGLIDVQNQCDGFAASANVLRRVGGRPGAAIKLAPHTTVCRGASLTGNPITMGVAAPAIVLEAVSDVSVGSNQITYTVPAPSVSAIYVKTTRAADPVSGVSFNGNVIRAKLGITYAITFEAYPLAARFGTSLVVSEGNTAEGATFGVRCDAVDDSQFPSPIRVARGALPPTACGRLATL